MKLAKRRLGYSDDSFSIDDIQSGLPSVDGAFMVNVFYTLPAIDSGMWSPLVKLSSITYKVIVLKS